MAGAAGISAITSLATLPLKAGFAALSIAGGVLNIAGSTLASANLLTTGALMASGGLHGRRSGNVKKDEAKQTQMAESSGKKKGPTGGGGGGASNSLANVKSTLADYNEPEGSMSMLPTGDEDGMGMLSGMLRQIAVNTSYLGGIDSKINALVGLSSMPLIDQAQETKGGEGSEGEGRDGIIRRSFNSLSNGIGRITGSLGTAVKNIVKGLALVAAFLTFKKFEPEITSGLASLFENVSGFFDTLSAGGDPSEGILGYFDNMMETSILPALTTMAEKALEVIFEAVAIAINKVTGIDIFDRKAEASGQPGDTSESQRKTENYLISGKDLGSVTGYGPFGDSGPAFKDITLGDYAFGGKGDVSPDESADVKKAVRERLGFMYKKFMESDGRIRWTEIGRGFTKGRGIDSLNGTFRVEDILKNSRPIIDGFIRNDEKAALNSVLPAKDMTSLTGDAFIKFEQNLKDLSKNKQIMQAGGGFLDAFLFEGPNIGTQLSPDEATERFQQLLKQQNLLKNDDGASLGNKGNGDVAMIDSSTTVNPYNDNRISGLTSAINSNLDLVTFFGNNQAV